MQPGSGLMLMLSPLGAEMFCVVEQMGRDKEGLFGPAGAYAQAYGLFSVAIAMGVIFGPIYAGALYEKANWPVAVCALAGFCASGSIPIVGSPSPRAASLALSSIWFPPFLYFFLFSLRTFQLCFICNFLYLKRRSFH